MTAALGTLALAMAAWIAFALATSLLASAAWPLLRRRLARCHPVTRARAILTVAVAPVLAPILLVGLCFAPGILALGWGADHCLQHPAHPHLCLAHGTAPLTPPLVALLVVGGTSLAVGCLTLARRISATRESLAQLRTGASRDLAPGVRCVESRRPFSLTAGLPGSEIFVSSALAEGLARPHLDAVIEHERAHARRRDGLVRLLAWILSWPHRPPLRREVLAALDLAAEQACDEEAGERLGDRLRVAEAILAVERLLTAAPIPGPARLLAFGGSSVAERVRALLGEPATRPAPRMLSWGAGALLLGACGLADPLHHATEHLLGLLL